jgi:hypothetical protein
MRSLVAAASLALALPAMGTQDQVTSVIGQPAGADSHTVVSVQVNGVSLTGCVATHGSAVVDGNTINVTIARVPQSICTQIVSPWSVPVFVGTLRPGTYTVVAKTAEVPSKTAVATLSVSDAEATFRVDPPVLPLSGGRVRLISGAEPFCHGSDPCLPATVTFDDVPALSSGPGILAVVAPPHAAGAVTVKVTLANGDQFVAVGGLRYYDPAAATIDPAAFERVLVPLVFGSPGAFGSIWTSDLYAHNSGDSEIELPDSPFPTLPCNLPPCDRLIPPSVSVRYPSPESKPFPQGRWIYVPRALSANVQLALRIRDLSRQAESSGTEIPVIHERDFLTGKMAFLNVPASDALLRFRLRMYAGSAQTIFCHLFGRTSVADFSLRLREGSGNLPAYGEIDLEPSLSKMLDSGPYTLEVTAPFPAWGFITVTNNTTQQVTVISPVP